jgi:hypothetical protein
MLFPKSRLRFTTTYQGKTSDEGWLVLDITALEMEGVNKIYIPMKEIHKAKEAGDTASDRLKQARSLLGGWDEEGS